MLLSLPQELWLGAGKGLVEEGFWIRSAMVNKSGNWSNFCPLSKASMDGG